MPDNQDNPITNTNGNEIDIEKQQIIDSIVDNLLSGIDLPGDKEIDRTPQSIDQEEIVDEREDVLGEGKFYKPADQVVYDKRPELKTDQKRRITSDDLSSLLKDFDKAMAGGKVNRDEPIFGKDIEKEKKVEELDELKDQKLARDKSNAQYQSKKESEITPPENMNTQEDFLDEIPPILPEEDFKLEEPQEPEELKIEETMLVEDLHSDDIKNDITNQEETNEQLTMDDVDFGNMNIHDEFLELDDTENITPDIQHDLEHPEDHEFGLSDVQIEDDFNFAEVPQDTKSDEEPSEVYQEAFSVDDIDMSSVQLTDENKNDFHELVNDDIIQTQDKNTMQDQELSEDLLEDVDDKLKDEIIDYPDTSFDEITSTSDTIKEDKPDFEDMDNFVGDREKIITSQVSQIKSDTEKDKIISPIPNLKEEETEEIFVSEFSDLKPINNITHESNEENTIEELEAPEFKLESDFDQIPDLEIPDDIPKSTQEQISKSYKPQDDIEFEELKLPVQEEINLQFEKDLIPDKEMDINEPIPQLIEQSSLEEEIQTFNEPQTPIYEQEQVEVEPRITPVMEDAKVPVEETEHGELDFSDEEMQIIQRNLQQLPQPLSGIATDTIINEKLPINDLKFLTQKLIDDPNQEEIKNFLEDRLNITIPTKKTITHTYTPQRPKQQASSLLKGVIAASFILLALILGYFLAYKPYSDKKKLYTQGLLDIEKGSDHYKSAEKKFLEAQSISDGDIDWINKYADQFIKQGDVDALYNAHKILLGDESENKDWYAKYKSRNPGAEDFDSKDFKAINANKKFPDNKETKILIAELFKKKALFSAKLGEWKDVDTYFSLADERGYKEFLNKHQNDIPILSKQAKLYILWGNTVKNHSMKVRMENLKIAEDIYLKKIQKIDPDNPIALYGLLDVYLNQRNDKSKEMDFKIDGLYKHIETINPSELDENALAEYAYYLNIKNKDKKAISILNRIIREGKLYPKAYYYLGLIYDKYDDPGKSLESYIKGLYAYYFIKIGKTGQKVFHEKISKGNLNEQVIALEDETIRMITDIRNDKDAENNALQAKFFNKIGNNYLRLTKGLRNNVSSEKSKKNTLFNIAKKSFLLAQEKNPNDYEPLKNLGDFEYQQAIKESDEEDNKKRFDTAKSYYLNALALLIKNQKISNPEHSQIAALMHEAQKKNIQDPYLFYHLGYIFYKLKEYNTSAILFEAINNNPTFLQNQTLNFALGNCYLKQGYYNLAERFYEKVIEYYQDVANNYKDNFDPNSLRQNEVFARLAKAYNNLGVTFHIRAEKSNDKLFMQKALEFYTRANESAKKLHINDIIFQEKINTETLYQNLIYLKHDNVKLEKRKIKDPKTKEDAAIKPTEHLIVDHFNHNLVKN